MLAYFLRRTLLLIPVLLTVATLVFFMLRLVPGDPVDMILGENAQPSDRQALREEHHFNDPIYVQYGHYMVSLFHGDLGTSYFTRQSVTEMILERFPATLLLAFLAILWAVCLAVPLGLVSALKKGTLTDKTCLVFSLFGISIPSFYLGPLLVLFFSIFLGWFPVAGRELPGSFVLPSFTLGAAMAALLTRMTRSSMLDVLPMDYVRTAKAKGLSQSSVLFKHAFGTALVPVVAILGLQFGTLLAGAIVTEKIFSWPGLGSLMLESISRRDYSVVQGCVLVISSSYVIVNLMTDLLYARLDPRIELRS